MGETDLLIEAPVAGVVVLTLNRPEQLNAVDMALSYRLMDVFAKLAQDDKVNAIVLTGSGAKAFCAGYDINEFLGLDPPALLATHTARDPLLWQIANHPKPVIAALNGLAYGAGALLALACDIRVGCSKTRFLVTATKYGAAMATWSLPQVVGFSKAKEILLLGRTLESDECKTLGILNFLVDDGEVLAHSLELAETISKYPVSGPRLVKKLINDGLGRTYEDQYRADHMAMYGSNVRPGNEIFGNSPPAKKGQERQR